MRDKAVYLNYKDIKDIYLGYSITIHKAQGSEFDNVVIILPDILKDLFTKNILYTAITRAKKKLLIICKNSAIVDVANKDSENRNRNTVFNYISTLLINSTDDEFKNKLKYYRKLFNNFVPKTKEGYSKIKNLAHILKNFSSIFIEDIAKDVDNDEIDDFDNDD